MRAGRVGFAGQCLELVWWGPNRRAAGGSMSNLIEGGRKRKEGEVGRVEEKVKRRRRRSRDGWLVLGIC